MHAQVQREQIGSAGRVGQNRDPGIAQRVAHRRHGPVAADRDDAVEGGGVREQLFDGSLPHEVAHDDLLALRGERAQVVVEAGVTASGARVHNHKRSHRARPPRSQPV